MPRQLPDVRSDKGYQNEAREFARKIMRGMIPCKDLNNFPNWLEDVITTAYLYGAQSAIRIGYHLCDNDWEATINMYKRQIEELKGE